MTSPRTSGPCAVWDPIWVCDALADIGAVTGTAVEVATEILYGLSGRRFDVCQIELWPCKRDCLGDVWPYIPFLPEVGGTYPRPALIGGAWFNLTCGSCMDQCACSPLSQVKLPGPVIRIVEVRVDNEILTQDVDYRLDDGVILTRLNDASWPLCNDFAQVTGTGTWSVTIEYGEEVPTSGRVAVGELACEIAKALIGTECQLPRAVQQLTRQGISMTFMDPNSIFEQGITGLYFSDLFINTYNPKHKPSRSRVYNIDEPDPHRLGT